MSEVFVAGSLHWDVVVDAPRLPGLDETLMGHQVDYRFGGKGGNQAVAAARMGASVAMAGRVGRDDAARRLRAALDNAGVDHTQVLESDTPSGMSVAIVDAHGEYGAVVVSGANATVQADEIALPPDLKVLLLQNEIPQAVNLSLAQRAPDACCVILNAAPARETSAELFAHVDILIANRVEAAELTGAETAMLNGEAATRALCALGPTTAVVTLGADGLWVADDSGCERVAAFTVDAVSSHGAGDAFCGALAAEVARGANLNAACRFAAAAAALAVSAPAGSRDQITEEAVRRLAGQTVSIL